MIPNKHPFGLGGQRGWVTMLETDFSSLPYQLLSGDAIYTIDGEPWEKIHTAGERSNCELNAGVGDGVTIYPAQAPSLTPSQWDAPALAMDLSTLVPNWDYSMGVRISIYNSSLNPNANYDRCGVFIGAKVATTVDNGVMWKADRGRCGTGNNGIESAFFVNGTNLSTYLWYDTTATHYTSKEEVTLQVDRLDQVDFLRYCDAGSFPYNSIYNSSLLATNWQWAGVGVGYKLRKPLYVGFFAFRTGSATALVAKIKSVKIEVKFS
jgi:hypothetical protein